MFNNSYTNLFDFRNKTFKHRKVKSDKLSKSISLNQELPTRQPKLHLWVYDLKGLDSICKDYPSQSLVIVRGSTKKELKYKSWEEIQQLPCNTITQCISEVIIIPRSAHGQYYIVNGLYSSLHFSLGPNGRHAFIIFLHHCGINVNFGCQSPVVFVKTSVQYKKTKIENEYFNLMVRMGSQLWHALFVVSS